MASHPNSSASDAVWNPTKKRKLLTSTEEIESNETDGCDKLYELFGEMQDQTSNYAGELKNEDSLGRRIRDISLYLGDNRNSEVRSIEALRKIPPTVLGAQLGLSQQECEIYDKQRITVWDPTERRRIAGMDAPQRKDLERFLRENPHYEICIDRINVASTSRACDGKETEHSPGVPQGTVSSAGTTLTAGSRVESIPNSEYLPTEYQGQRHESHAGPSNEEEIDLYCNSVLSDEDAGPSRSDPNDGVSPVEERTGAKAINAGPVFDEEANRDSSINSNAIEIVENEPAPMLVDGEPAAMPIEDEETEEENDSVYLETEHDTGYEEDDDDDDEEDDDDDDDDEDEDNDDNQQIAWLDFGEENGGEENGQDDGHGDMFELGRLAAEFRNIMVDEYEYLLRARQARDVDAPSAHYTVAELLETFHTPLEVRRLNPIPENNGADENDQDIDGDDEEEPVALEHLD